MPGVAVSTFRSGHQPQQLPKDEPQGRWPNFCCFCQLLQLGGKPCPQPWAPGPNQSPLLPTPKSYHCLAQAPEGTGSPWLPTQMMQGLPSPYLMSWQQDTLAPSHGRTCMRPAGAVRLNQRTRTVSRLCSLGWACTLLREIQRLRCPGSHRAQKQWLWAGTGHCHPAGWHPAGTGQISTVKPQAGRKAPEEGT